MTPALQGRAEPTAGAGCHLQQFPTASEEGVALGSLLQLLTPLLDLRIQGGQASCTSASCLARPS